MDRVEERYESERMWFRREHGCTRGCSIPFALILVSLGCILLDSAYSRVSLRDRISGGVESGDDGFASYSDRLRATAPLGDALLRPGPYVLLERDVQVYCWVEIISREQGRTDYSGGRRRVTTTYRYEERWTSHSPRTETFHEPRGHFNPPSSSLRSRVLWAQGASLGRFVLPTSELDGRGGEPLEPTASQLMPGARLVGGYVTRGKGGLLTRVGDERVKYRALRVGEQATFFGKVDADQLRPMPLASSPRCILRLGPPEKAAKRARGDLAKGALGVCVIAWLLVWTGIEVGLAASLVWIQRSSFGSIRRGVHVVLGGVAGVASFLLVAPAAFAVIQLEAPIEIVWITMLLLTLAGLLAFRHMARRAQDLVDSSFIWGFLLG